MKVQEGEIDRREIGQYTNSARNTKYFNSLNFRLIYNYLYLVYIFVLSIYIIIQTFLKFISYVKIIKIIRSIY